MKKPSPHQHAPVDDVPEAVPAQPGNQNGHDGPDRIPFTWSFLVQLHDWSLLTYPPGHFRPAAKFLTKQVLFPDNSELMSVARAKAITQPVVTSLFLEWLADMELDLRRLAPPPVVPGEDAMVQAARARYAALRDKICGVKALVLYIDAMRLMYVDYGMANYAITSEHSPPVHALFEGFEFFEAWHADWAAVPFVRRSDRNRYFLSDTTWQQLKLSFLGKIKFIRLYFRQHPNGRLFPRRMTQSVLESLFGELRSFSRGTAGFSADEYCKRAAALIIRRQTRIIDTARHVPTQQGLLYLRRAPTPATVQEAERQLRALFQ
jgi:hypothetical protein